MLSCIFENGTLAEWRVSDWSVAKKATKKQLMFEASTYNHPANSTIVYAHNSKTSVNCIEQYFENNTTKSIQVDIKITSMIEVQVKKEKSCFLLAL